MQVQEGRGEVNMLELVGDALDGLVVDNQKLVEVMVEDQDQKVLAVEHLYQVQKMEEEDLQLEGLLKEA